MENININQVIPQSPVTSIEQQNEIYMKTIPSQVGLDMNYTASNKWFAYIPLQNVLGNKYRNLDLHVKSFSIPQMEQSSTEVSFKGYKKTIPTKVINSETKELTIEYIIDAKWFNYKSLYAWMCGITGSYPNVTDDVTENISPDSYMPVRIYLLDNYKHKIIEFLFQNCWIKTFNDLRLEANNPGEVVGSITMCYDLFSISDI